MNATPLDFAKAREAMVEQQVRPWDVLDVRVLEVPADYQKIDMSGMGGLMKGMMKGFGR